jgi:streptogramin lyase
MNKRRLAAALAFCFASLTQVAAGQVITEFPIPRAGSSPLQIAPGPDGVWFTENAANRIGLITPEGNLTEFPVARRPIAIVSGPDGNLWFTERGAGQIGRVRIDDLNANALRLGRFDVQVWGVPPEQEGNLDWEGLQSRSR